MNLLMSKKGARELFRRKKSKATKTLAIFLAILLVAYNVPIGISSTGFAQSDAFTLQILNNGVPVANKEVFAHNGTGGCWESSRSRGIQGAWYLS